MKAASQGHAPRIVNNVLPVCSRHSSDHCFHASCPCVVCLPSLQEQHGALWALSQPSLLTFKTRGFMPHWLPKLMKFSPSHFPIPCLWGIILMFFQCASLSFAILHDYGSLPFTAPLIHFSFKPCLRTSYLFDLASSLPLVAEFVPSVFRLISRVFRMIL